MFQMIVKYFILLCFLFPSLPFFCAYRETEFRPALMLIAEDIKIGSLWQCHDLISKNRSFILKYKLSLRVTIYA